MFLEPLQETTELGAAAGGFLVPEKQNYLRVGGFRPHFASDVLLNLLYAFSDFPKSLINLQSQVTGPSGLEFCESPPQGTAS